MRNTIRFRIEYAGFMLLYALVRVLPRRAALGAGALLGLLMRLTQGKRRRKALENLRHAFPALGDEGGKSLLRENFRQLGISGVEMLRLDLYRDTASLPAYFEVKGIEQLQEALAGGQGCFLLTGHVGFWEAGSIVLPLLGIPMDVIYKRMKNPHVEQRILALREAAGARAIEKRRAARKILRSLAENRAVAVLIDQRVSSREGVRVDFFARPANATPIIAQMAIKQGTPVVPTFCRRLRDNRYEIVFEPMLRFPQDENPAPEAVVAATQVMTAAIEAAVRRDPEQWFWLHDRWRL